MYTGGMLLPKPFNLLPIYISRIHTSLCRPNDSEPVVASLVRGIPHCEAFMLPCNIMTGYLRQG